MLRSLEMDEPVKVASLLCYLPAFFCVDILRPKGRCLMQLIVEYPNLLPDALQQSRADFESEAKMAMAVKLFEMKRISSGIAARLAGVDRVTFLLGLHRYGVAMIDLDEDELLADLQNA
jgi:predicted HTH domain antitoxin